MIGRQSASGGNCAGRGSDSGVTLLELLTAVAITAMVLVAVSLMAVQLSAIYARFSRDSQGLAQWYAVDRVLSGVAQAADRVSPCGPDALCLTLAGGSRLPPGAPPALRDSRRIRLSWVLISGKWRLELFADPPLGSGRQSGSGGNRGPAGVRYWVGEFSSAGSPPAFGSSGLPNGFSVAFPGGQSVFPGQFFLIGKVP